MATKFENIKSARNSSRPKIRRIGRRMFLSELTIAFSLLLSPWRNLLPGRPNKARDLIDELEMNEIEQSRPVRNSDLACKGYKDQSLLLKTGHARLVPTHVMNPVGRAIWDACNGSNKPSDIARIIHEQYSIVLASAYEDTLAFLIKLKRINAIRL